MDLCSLFFRPSDCGVMRAGRVGSSAQRFEQQGEGGEERAGGLASEQDDAVPVGKRVGIVT